MTGAGRVILADKSSNKVASHDNMTTGQMAHRLWHDYIKHYKGKLAFAFVLMIFLAAVNVAFPAAMEWIFSGLGQINNCDCLPESPQATANNPPIDRVMIYGPIMLIGVGFSLAAGRYLYSRTTQSLAVGVLRDLQKDMFAHYLRYDFAQTREEGAGQLVSRFTNDTTILRDSLVRGPNAVKDILMLIGLISWLLYLDWILFLVVVLIYPIVGLPITSLGRYLRRTAQRGTTPNRGHDKSAYRKHAQRPLGQNL